jgi:hypothetical protein
VKFVGMDSSPDKLFEMSKIIENSELKVIGVSVFFAEIRELLPEVQFELEIQWLR